MSRIIKQILSYLHQNLASMLIPFLRNQLKNQKSMDYQAIHLHVFNGAILSFIHYSQYLLFSCILYCHCTLTPLFGALASCICWGVKIIFCFPYLILSLLLSLILIILLCILHSCAYSFLLAYQLLYWIGGRWIIKDSF